VPCSSGCWLSTATARVRSRIRSCGIYDRQSGTRAGFLRVLRFPLPSIPPTTSHSSSSWAGRIGKRRTDSENYLYWISLQIFDERSYPSVYLPVCYPISATAMINFLFKFDMPDFRPPLWSSGQSYWLLIERSGFYSRRYQIFLRSNESETEPTQPNDEELLKK
jgi:hypothetical protein